MRHKWHLVGGDEGATLLAESNAWMECQDIKNSTRMVRIVAPGFDRDE